MVNANLSASKSHNIKYRGWSVYEDLLANLGYTFTCSDFTSTATLDQAYLINNSSGAEVTVSVSNNVVSVTDAVTNVYCTLIVFGVKTQ
jgi:hypothetical protein